MQLYYSPHTYQPQSTLKMRGNQQGERSLQNPTEEETLSLDEEIIRRPLGTHDRDSCSILRERFEKSEPKINKLIQLGREGKVEHQTVLKKLGSYFDKFRHIANQKIRNHEDRKENLVEMADFCDFNDGYPSAFDIDYGHRYSEINKELGTVKRKKDKWESFKQQLEEQRQTFTTKLTAPEEKRQHLTPDGILQGIGKVLSWFI
jgi:hypothetical protein